MEPSPLPPPRARRTTGWSEEPSKFSKDSVKSLERLTIIDSDDDVPIIPDLEEIQDDASFSVIGSNSFAVVQVAKFKEMDMDLLKHSAFSGYESAMLRILTEGMSSEFEVKEHDAEFTWHKLFAKISSGTSS